MARLVFNELRGPLPPWVVDEILRVDDHGVWISSHPSRRAGWSDALLLEVSDPVDHLQGPLIDDLFWIPSAEFDDASKTPESTPALAFPFELSELAAFMLAGWGARLRVFYFDGALGPTADESKLQERQKQWNRRLTRRGAAAREILVKAYAALCHAVSVVGVFPSVSFREELSEEERHRHCTEQQESYQHWRQAIVMQLLGTAAMSGGVHVAASRGSSVEELAIDDTKPAKWDRLLREILARLEITEIPLAAGGASVSDEKRRVFELAFHPDEKYAGLGLTESKLNAAWRRHPKVVPSSKIVGGMED